MKKWMLSLFCCLLSFLAQAQFGSGPSSFKIALPVGVNSSQIKGDPYQGYLKWGLSAGVEGLAQLDEKHQLSVGVLFQQVGGFPSNTEIKRDGENYLDMRLTYIEIPVMLHFLWGKKKDYHRFDWHFGGSVARLLSSRFTGTRTVPVGGGEPPLPIFDLIDRQADFRDFSFQGIIGIRYYLHPQVNLTLRHTYAFSSFFQPSEVDIELNQLNNFYWSFLVAYVLE
ncbi:MAG: hypothetical protein Sapg2KO_07360 [Saprospiraceae bacterium]